MVPHKKSEIFSLTHHANGTQRDPYRQRTAICGVQLAGSLREVWSDWTTTVYHPRENPIERRNQEIKKSLRLHTEGERQQDWDEHISSVLFSLRCWSIAATGFSSGEVLFG
jgi:endonuclease I